MGTVTLLQCRIIMYRLRKTCWEYQRTRIELVHTFSKALIVDNRCPLRQTAVDRPNAEYPVFSNLATKQVPVNHFRLRCCRSSHFTERCSMIAFITNQLKSWWDLKYYLIFKCQDKYGLSTSSRRFSDWDGCHKIHIIRRYGSFRKCRI